MPALALRIAHRPQQDPIPAPAPLITIARQSRQNRLLKSLPEDVWDRISPHLALIELPLGSCLIHEACGLVKYVYFPTNAIISLLCVMENGASAQTAMVGSEGMVGISPFMGLETSPTRAVVQTAGYAFKLPARVLMHEFEHTPVVTRMLLRYTQLLMTQMGQTVGCNRHHSIEKQLCRWLLSSLDRLSGNELAMTQEFISNLIGVRREGVTEAAGKLQRLGMIRYSRGRITVVDRPALERHACECYSMMRRETERLSPSSHPN